MTVCTVLQSQQPCYEQLMSVIIIIIYYKIYCRYVFPCVAVRCRTIIFCKNCYGAIYELLF